MAQKHGHDQQFFRRGARIMTKYEVNGIAVEQRMLDGFINATEMCVAHGKLLKDWFSNQSTIDILHALAEEMGLEVKEGNSPLSNVSAVSSVYPKLVVSRRGSPSSGGGTWVHPDLAIQLAQWCSPRFAIQVSRWVREWMTSAYNPIQLEADADRVRMRDTLKDKKRLEFTDQIKAFLEEVDQYHPGTRETTVFFSTAHDALNMILTGETSKGMRLRLEAEMGRTVTNQELIRDYFPIEDLANYAAMCQAAANEMAMNHTMPRLAIEIASKQVLPRNHVPKPINFTERIGLVRRRLEQRDQLLLGGAIPILGEVA
jgi:hypothetical protein